MKKLEKKDGVFYTQKSAETKDRVIATEVCCPDGKEGEWIEIDKDTADAYLKEIEAYQAEEEAKREELKTKQEEEAKALEAEQKEQEKK